MRVKATLHVNGNPLRRTYVEHLVWGVGTDMYMTDLEGRIRDEHFDEGIDSFGSHHADIRIICQNPIVRVLDGKNWNIGVYHDRHIIDGSSVDIHSADSPRDWYDILNRAQIAYEVSFQPLSFFSSLAKPQFPLGRASSLRATRDQAKRIDLSYPDQFPNDPPDHSHPPITFVEPKRLFDGYPLMHLKDKSIEDRLFGIPDFSTPDQQPMIVPHELTHALHFSFLSEDQRGRAQDDYIGFITESLAAGEGGTHDFTVRTTPEVAYIEAGAWYSQNFSEFMRVRQGGTSSIVTPEPITPAIQAEFVAAELKARLNPVHFASPGVLPVVGLPGGVAPHPAPVLSVTLDPHVLHLPSVTGGDVEGAVYCAIFVDFASRVGLDLAASSFFAANALTFGEYQTFIDSHHSQHSATLEAVRKFWKL